MLKEFYMSLVNPKVGTQFKLLRPTRMYRITVIDNDRYYAKLLWSENANIHKYGISGRIIDLKQSSYYRELTETEQVLYGRTT